MPRLPAALKFPTALFLIFLFAVFLSSCRQKDEQPSAMQIQLAQQMKSFFTVPASDSQKLQGIWQAEHETIVNAIEQKYLKSYSAQPDEASREVLRDRLKTIEIYLRIENQNVQMLTFSGEGNLGNNTGKITGQSKNSAQLTLTGKNNSQTSVELKFELNNANRFKYLEDGTEMTFLRETRSAEQISSSILQKLKNAGSLPEY
ncbi:MAG: hypothetical protein KDK38_10235 [Leptospiraceae bacterium]|nr:hypothetical protein [Leptospiraceae bacterium]